MLLEQSCNVTPLAKLKCHLEEKIKDPQQLRLLSQMISRVETKGGLFWDHNQGLPRNCSLSPLMGAIYLSGLDRIFEKNSFADKVKQFRYQDDILVLAKTRWHLRKAIKIIKQHVASLKLELHPGKTFVGRTSSGFDFLGFHFKVEKS